MAERRYLLDFHVPAHMRGAPRSRATGSVGKVGSLHAPASFCCSSASGPQTAFPSQKHHALLRTPVPLVWETKTNDVPDTTTDRAPIGDVNSQSLHLQPPRRVLCDSCAKQSAQSGALGSLVCPHAVSIMPCARYRSVVLPYIDADAHTTCTPQQRTSRAHTPSTQQQHTSHTHTQHPHDNNRSVGGRTRIDFGVSPEHATRTRQTRFSALTNNPSPTTTTTTTTTRTLTASSRGQGASDFPWRSRSAPRHTANPIDVHDTLASPSMHTDARHHDIAAALVAEEWTVADSSADAGERTERDTAQSHDGGGGARMLTPQEGQALERSEGHDVMYTVETDNPTAHTDAESNPVARADSQDASESDPSGGSSDQSSSDQDEGNERHDAKQDGVDHKQESGGTGDRNTQHPTHESPPSCTRTTSSASQDQHIDGDGSPVSGASARVAPAMLDGVNQRLQELRALPSSELRNREIAVLTRIMRAVEGRLHLLSGHGRVGELKGGSHQSPQTDVCADGGRCGVDCKSEFTLSSPSSSPASKSKPKTRKRRKVRKKRKRRKRKTNKGLPAFQHPRLRTRLPSVIPQTAARRHRHDGKGADMPPLVKQYAGKGRRGAKRVPIARALMTVNRLYNWKRNVDYETDCRRQRHFASLMRDCPRILQRSHGRNSRSPLRLSRQRERSVHVPALTGDQTHPSDSQDLHQPYAQFARQHPLPSQNPIGGGSPLYTQGVFSGKRREAWTTLNRERQAENEVSECTFSPSILERSQLLDKISSPARMHAHDVSDAGPPPQQDTPSHRTADHVMHGFVSRLEGLARDNWYEQVLAGDVIDSAGAVAQAHHRVHTVVQAQQAVPADMHAREQQEARIAQGSPHGEPRLQRLEGIVAAQDALRGVDDGGGVGGAGAGDEAEVSVSVLSPVLANQQHPHTGYNNIDGDMGFSPPVIQPPSPHASAGAGTSGTHGDDHHHQTNSYGQTHHHLHLQSDSDKHVTSGGVVPPIPAPALTSADPIPPTGEYSMDADIPVVSSGFDPPPASMEQDPSFIAGLLEDSDIVGVDELQDGAFEDYLWDAY